MAATVKKDKNILQQEADKASTDQMNDIFAQISNLGAPSKTTTAREVEPEEVEDEEPVIRRATEKKPVVRPKQKADDKRGFISLVVSPSLKAKWKTYSTNHGMSLTDCIKLGMKLLEEMEQQGILQIEDGVVTMSN